MRIVDICSLGILPAISVDKGQHERSQKDHTHPCVLAPTRADPRPRTSEAAGQRASRQRLAQDWPFWLRPPVLWRPGLLTYMATAACGAHVGSHRRTTGVRAVLVRHPKVWGCRPATCTSRGLSPTAEGRGAERHWVIPTVRTSRMAEGPPSL